MSLPQLAAGGGEEVDGFKGYCCVCNLTPNLDLKKIFVLVISEPGWHRVAKGCRHQSYLRCCDMFCPLGISEKCM